MTPVTPSPCPPQDAVAIQMEEARLVKIKEVLKELPAPHYRYWGGAQPPVPVSPKCHCRP